MTINEKFAIMNKKKRLKNLEGKYKLKAELHGPLKKDLN